MDLLDSDLIYISGGNTFDLLQNIKNNELEEDLYNYAKAGGCLAEHGAGAIVLTPNINTAAFPPEDCDENDAGLEEFDSVSLVAFEIFPHYENISFYKKALTSYTRLLKSPLYAIEDGSDHFHIDNNGITFFGNITSYIKGKFAVILSCVKRTTFLVMYTLKPSLRVFVLVSFSI